MIKKGEGVKTLPNFKYIYLIFYNKLATKIPSGIYNEFPSIIEKFQINTPLRLAHFLSQTAHESGNFKIFTENLNYGKAGLMSIFKKYFPTEALALQYERKPEKIANKVYASRMGNGDEASGDGWKYRGRGAIQLTGKVNYTEFDKFVDDDILGNPDLVTSKYPLASAAWFWSKNGLNAIADKGATPDVVMQLTKRINGGTHGLSDRQKHFDHFIKVLG